MDKKLSYNFKSKKQIGAILKANFRIKDSKALVIDVSETAAKVYFFEDSKKTIWYPDNELDNLFTHTESKELDKLDSLVRQVSYLTKDSQMLYSILNVFSVMMIEVIKNNPDVRYEIGDIIKERINIT